MPLASLLETNKPFAFASSHSTGSSTELASPSSTISSLPRQVNNSTSSTSSSSPPSITVNHSKLLPSSPLDLGHYHSSTISNDYDSPIMDDSTHQTTTTTTETLPSYYNSQLEQPKGVSGYSLSTTGTKSLHDHNTSYPTSTHNSQLLSPSTPAASLPLITTAATTTTNTITANTPPPPPPPPALQQQNSLPFTSQQLPTPHLQDSSFTLPSPNVLSKHSVPSPHQNLHTVDHLQKQLFHHQQQEEKTLVLKKTPRTLSPPPPPPSLLSTLTTATPPQPSLLLKETLLPVVSTPTTLPSAPKRTTEGDSGYFDSSTTENRRVKRRKELNQRIDGLTNDFNQNRERIFAEKLLVIQNEISQTHNNTHQQYKEGLILLESIRQKTIDHGQLFRDYQTQVTDRQFTLEIHHAEEEYLAERNEVREKLFAVLEEKRRKLKEDKDNCDLAYDVVLESQTRMNKRSLRKRGMENGDGKLNKRKQLSGPALVFRLKDEEMYDDLQAMRNGLSIQAKKPSHKKK